MEGILFWRGSCEWECPYALDKNGPDMALPQYDLGTTTLRELIEVFEDAFSARLELWDDSKERIAIFRDRIVLAKKILEKVEARHKLGLAPQFDVFRTRAFVLRTQIDLLRETEKAKIKKADQ